MTDTPLRRASRLLHHRRHSLAKGDAVPPPVELASMYHLPGDPAGARQYGRYDNASWQAVEATLSILEDAPALAFPSGMAAITAALFSTLRAGDRLLLPADGYHATRLLAERFLTPMGIVVDRRATAAFLEGGVEGYRVVFVETPANPGLDLCDIAAVAASAHDAGAIVVADNTTMTPFGQRPLDFGADLVVAADTKAPNGHSDVLFGHVAGRDAKLMQAVGEWRRVAGAIPGPFEAWLVHRGLETLELRFERMCDTAERIAPRLAAHPAVRSVRYPGLPDDPAHGLAATQMDRFGFLIGLTFAGEDTAERFIDGCALLQPATSFGGVHSSAERRRRWGDAVEAGFVRLSVGCEPSDELWAALEAALDPLPPAR